MKTEVVYIGRDNTIDLQLRDDSASPGTLADTDLSMATKVAVVVDGANEYDSTSDPETVTFTPAGIVSIKLGAVLTTAGNYTMEIVVYDATNTAGVAWAPRVSVKAIAPGNN